VNGKDPDRNLARCHAAAACEDLRTRLRVTRACLFRSLRHLLALVNGSSRKLDATLRQNLAIASDLTAFTSPVIERVPIC